MMNWWPLLLGWPAMLVALALSTYGISNRKPWSLFVAMLLVLPISLYLAGTPRFSVVGLTPALALFSAGMALRRQKTNLAWGLLFLAVAFIAWLIFVLQQPIG